MRCYHPIKLTIVDSIYQEYSEILLYLMDNGEISLASHAENSFRKTFLLSCASYWESELQSIIEKMAINRTNSDIKLTSLIKSKVISRQYHTWFDWKNRSATTFFAMFGEEYKLEYQAYLKSDIEFKSSIDAFMEIGSIRNLLVHNNFASYPIDKTLDEIYNLYQLGMGFIDHCEVNLL